MQKPTFVGDQIYHVYNRGVEKRTIFEDEKDYFRFMHNLFEFNDSAPAGKFSDKKLDKIKTSTKDKLAEVAPPNVKKRELLVEILAFCLMPNHYHLILKQKKDKGIVDFMRKIGTGYSMYFNQKNERVGSLFQNRFKATVVDTDQYFLQLSRYIHLNPIGIITDQENPTWPTKYKFLKQYRWSSLPDYLNINNFASITSRDLLNGFFQNQDDHKTFLAQATEEEFADISEYTLE